jgi:hypothetical protein
LLGTDERRIQPFDEVFVSLEDVFKAEVSVEERHIADLASRFRTSPQIHKLFQIGCPVT